MNGLKDIAKEIMAAVCSVFGFVFGDWDGLMAALIILIIMDYVSGVIAAIAEKKLSSAVGAKGIAKKVFMLLIVAMANVADINIIGEGHVLKSVTAMFYAANECISLLENAGRLGVPVPKKLLDVLEQLKKEN
ncbi:MAG: phage holin family protein [Ruminococcus sp.]|nr:phage holin family protein [Ruminococcus sp.]